MYLSDATSGITETEPALLEVRNVSKVFTSGFTRNQDMLAVNQVSIKIPGNPAEIVTIAGESGSGKTTLAQMVLGFLAPTSGRIMYNGQDITQMDRRQSALYRQHVQAVFQNPFEAFNPFYSIDHALLTPIHNFHLASGKKAIDEMIQSVLDSVRLDHNETLGRYPHQMSGGQLQRIMIARSLLLKPHLLIADEPVSMIDVSLRAIILEILHDLKEQRNISLLYITHDLSTALQISDRIMILYRGNIVELGNASLVIQHPSHPYTQMLVQSIPIPDPTRRWSEPLSRQDSDPSAVYDGTGCVFFDRCPKRMEICRTNQPASYPVASNQQAACFLYEKTTS
jgi:oligopeptide/dipeptide ABC transporter ATP-binding protein